jgi:hypothetical protein
MDFATIIGVIAPVILYFVVQGAKKLVAINGYVALAVVFVIGGLSAILGLGPTPDIPGWLDTMVNAGWIVGVATFIYSLFKKRE